MKKATCDSIGSLVKTCLMSNHIKDVDTKNETESTLVSPSPMLYGGKVPAQDDEEEEEVDDPNPVSFVTSKDNTRNITIQDVSSFGSKGETSLVTPNKSHVSHSGARSEDDWLSSANSNQKRSAMANNISVPLGSAFLEEEEEEDVSMPCDPGVISKKHKDGESFLSTTFQTHIKGGNIEQRGKVKIFIADDSDDNTDDEDEFHGYDNESRGGQVKDSKSSLILERDIGVCVLNGNIQGSGSTNVVHDDEVTDKVNTDISQLEDAHVENVDYCGNDINRDRLISPNGNNHHSNKEYCSFDRSTNGEHTNIHHATTDGVHDNVRSSQVDGDYVRRHQFSGNKDNKHHSNYNNNSFTKESNGLQSRTDKSNDNVCSFEGIFDQDGSEDESLDRAEDGLLDTLEDCSENGSKDGSVVPLTSHRHGGVRASVSGINPTETIVVHMFDFVSKCYFLIMIYLTIKLSYCILLSMSEKRHQNWCHRYPVLRTTLVWTTYGWTTFHWTKWSGWSRRSIPSVAT